MPIISAVGFFCCNKFEETPNEKVGNMSKLTKSYFKVGDIVECWCYKLDQFKEDLLNKPFLKSYSSLEFPYSES